MKVLINQKKFNKKKISNKMKQKITKKIFKT